MDACRASIRDVQISIGIINLQLCEIVKLHLPGFAGDFREVGDSLHLDITRVFHNGDGTMDVRDHQRAAAIMHFDGSVHLRNSDDAGCVSHLQRQSGWYDDFEIDRVFRSPPVGEGSWNIGYDFELFRALPRDFNQAS